MHQSSGRNFRSHARVLGIHSAIVLSMLLLFSAQTAAQRPPQELERTVVELQANIDQLKREAALASEIGRVNQKLDALKASLDLQPRKTVAPAESGWALGIVGALFVVVWGFINVRREDMRHNELVLKTFHESLKSLTSPESGSTPSAMEQRITALTTALQKLRAPATANDQTGAKG